MLRVSDTDLGLVPGKYICTRYRAPAANEMPLAAQVWGALRSIDSTLPTIRMDGVGECTGDQLLVMWGAQELGRFLVIEVFDRVAHQLWQFALCPSDEGAQIAIWRLKWAMAGENRNDPVDSLRPSALASLIERVFSRLEGHDVAPKFEPHFVGLLGAALSRTGLASIKDDSAEITNLLADLHYWRDLARAQAKLLKDRLHPSAYTPPAAQSQPPSPPLPARQWRLDELAEWAALNSDRIVIAPRAIAAAKRSHYTNPSFVYQCLELLAEQYTLVKLGELDRNAFKIEAENLGLAFGGSVDPAVASSFGDEYFIRYGGRRRFLDQHLGKGTSRDQRFTMRIYFTWCDASNLVVVGWLPSHLGCNAS